MNYILFVLVTVFYIQIPTPITSNNTFKRFYALVIDAGSTGTRVFLFRFHECTRDHQLLLDEEIYQYTKPGLSHFANNPANASSSIRALVDKFMCRIPSHYWSLTPLVLWATAGLRLLSPKESTDILNVIRHYFYSLPFLTDDNSVKIIDGSEEGIFSWFTVNFLLNNVQHANETVATIDLGGTSLQSTFSALTPDTLKYQEDIHDALMPFGYTKVYSHCYLQLGLMAARKEVITKNQDNSYNVKSACINPLIENYKFHYMKVTYSVSGLLENHMTIGSIKNGSVVKQIVSYDECSKIIQEYLKSYPTVPRELTTKKIYIFGYFFNRAVESKIIDPTGGSVLVKDYVQKAKDVCLEENKAQPFMCLDLIYQTVLLTDVMGLPKDYEINLVSQIKNHEVSWTLGAAYTLLKKLQ